VSAVTQPDDLDEVAFRAWPAERVEVLEAWRARFTRGVTRRANSVMPRLDPRSGASKLEVEVSEAQWLARIEAVERLYREAGLAARFQIAPDAAPRDLDALLEARGYEIESPVCIQSASLDLLDGTDRGGPISALCEAAMSSAWFDAAARRGRFRQHPEVFEGIVSRLGDRAGFARAELDGETVATGLAVLDGAWVGVFAMRTFEAHRRRGAGRALLAAIVRWATTRGATQAYLQVERDNTSALALYGAAGFAEVYGYHYRHLRDVRGQPASRG